MRFSLKRSLGNAIPKLNVEGSSPFARFLASLEAVNPALRAGVTSLRSVTGPSGAPEGRCESLLG